MDTPFLGMIIPWPIPFAPMGWAFCQGQTLQVAQNQALFSLIGATYGGDGRTTFCLPDLRGRTIVGAGTGAGLTPRTVGQLVGRETTLLPNHTHSAALNATPVNVNTSGVSFNTTVSNVSTTATVSYGVPATTDTSSPTQTPGPDYVLGMAKAMPNTVVNTYFKPTDATKNVTLKPTNITVSATGGTASATTTMSGTMTVTPNGTVNVAPFGESNNTSANIQPSLVMNYIIALQGLYPTRD